MTRAKDRTAAAATTPAIEDVEELLDVAGDATHKVWFYRLRDGESPFLASVDPAKLRGPGIREYTRSRWGGGKFRAKLRRTDGAWGQSRSFEIEGEALTAKHDDAGERRGDRDRDGRRRRRRSEGESMLERILVPTAIALSAAIVKKMTDDPKTDPMMLELIRRTGRGESISPIELQRAIMEAESRGERRGRELGELKAQVEGDGPPASHGISESGVISAIRESAAAVKEVVSYAKGADKPAANIRIVRPPTNTAAPGGPSTPATTDAAPATPVTPDIVPEYLRALVAGKSQLLWAIDADLAADSIVNAIINKATDEQIAQLFEAHDANRLESDLTAAIPELATESRRDKFAELLTEMSAAVKAIRGDAKKEA